MIIVDFLGYFLKVKIIKCDNETEFKNADLNQFCGLKGIKREFSVPGTPQQNGIAERKNRTLIEAIRTLLADLLLPIPFWAEAVNTACYVQNMVLVTKPHNKTPYELLHGRLPSIGFMRPFGCPVTILNTLDPLGKFQGNVDEGFLVGYSVCSKNNKDAHTDGKEHNDDIQKFMSPDIHSSSCGDQAREQGDKAVNKDKGKNPVVTITRFRDLNEEFAECIDNNSNGVNAAGSSVFTAELNFTNNTNDFSAAGVRDQGGISQMFNKDFHTCMFACFLCQEEPKRVHQALKDPSWIEAMQEELLQFKMQKVWILVDLPYGKRAIGTKWVYRNKKDERGIFIRNKARLVAQGHTQEEGINYEEVFAPIARIKAIRLFLAYAFFMGFPMNLVIEIVKVMFYSSQQMVLNSPCLTHKKELIHQEATALSWLVQKQTAIGKDTSNPLIVDSLLKTIWCSIHHHLTIEVLAIPGQTTTGKESSNPFMAEFMIISGANNRPPMLDKSLYDSWKSHMEHYIANRENGRMILNSAQNGLLIWHTITEEDGTTRTKKYEELSATEKIQADCDCKATNIVLQVLPSDVYAIVNHNKVSKEIRDRVKLLMQGTKLSLQEKEFKLYDEFDKFTFVKGETLYQYC
nr:ribonuclease H-like domain-containing protein [Tanacetum cinerariifolium]